jgi:hypothetical protein
MSNLVAHRGRGSISLEPKLENFGHLCNKSHDIRININTTIYIRVLYYPFQATL